MPGGLLDRLLSTQRSTNTAGDVDHKHLNTHTQIYSLSLMLRPSHTHTHTLTDTDTHYDFNALNSQNTFGSDISRRAHLMNAALSLVLQTEEL